MSLWNIIRDFFVRYIFGGIDSLNNFYDANQIGCVYSYIPGTDGGDPGLGSATEFWLFLPNTYDELTGTLPGADNLYITMADYLSTTATIIVMVLLCFLLVKLAIWIFKLGANLIRLR